MASTAAEDFKDHPDHFRCDRLSIWMHKRHCVDYQKKAVETANLGGIYMSQDRYFRYCSCLKCEQGKETKKHFKQLAPKPKPTTPAIQPKAKVKRKIMAFNPRNSIDYRALMQGYNQREGKGWTSVKMWLKWCYEQHGQNMLATAKFLGVSPDRLRLKFRSMGLYIKGLSDTGKAKFEAIPRAEMASMTKLDISRKTGLSIQRVSSLLTESQRPYLMSGTWRGRRRV